MKNQSPRAIGTSPHEGGTRFSRHFALVIPARDAPMKRPFMSIQERTPSRRKRRRLPGTRSPNSMTPCAASKGYSVRDTKQRRRIRTRSLFPGIVSRTHQKPPKRPSAPVFSRRDAAREEIRSTIQVSDPARRGAQRYLAQEIFIDCHCSFGGPRTLRGSRCVDSAMLHWRAQAGISSR